MLPFAHVLFVFFAYFLSGFIFLIYVEEYYLLIKIFKYLKCKYRAK